MTSIIALERITKTFPGVVALNDVTLEIAAGELHAICGENGAGKSTLMKIIAGVFAGDQGRLLVRGEEVHFRHPRDAEAAGISIIHQELNLVDQLSVAANIFLGRERQQFGLLRDRQMEQAARALLAELECDCDVRRPAGQLRIGDQQLIEIAKALSLNSDVLIMDEPTSALTETEVERLYRVVDRLRQRGVTILYISHKMQEIFRLADRITVLRDGRLVATRQRSETTPREITHLMVGREIEAVDLQDDRQPGPVVLEVRDLSLPWPGHARQWRLRNVSFELRQGEIVGIAGLMGAGRTELLESLFGASRDGPQGTILLNGRRVRFRTPAEAKRCGIAMVTEDRKRLGLFAQMSVGENITICKLREMAFGSFVVRGRERNAAQETVKNLNVRAAGLDASVMSLSGGNQQKCLIGRWLLTQPQILLLDDPTRGVDVGAKAEIYRLMDRLRRNGMAILLTSSELPELLAMSDRILVLSEGHLTGQFDRSEATEQRIMEAATYVQQRS